MSGRGAVVEFIRDEVLALAGPFKPGSEPWSALIRAADRLQDAAQAIRRQEAREASPEQLLRVVGRTEA